MRLDDLKKYCSMEGEEGRERAKISAAGCFGIDVRGKRWPYIEREQQRARDTKSFCSFVDVNNGDYSDHFACFAVVSSFVVTWL